MLRPLTYSRPICWVVVAEGHGLKTVETVGNQEKPGESPFYFQTFPSSIASCWLQCASDPPQRSPGSFGRWCCVGNFLLEFSRMNVLTLSGLAPFGSWIYPLQGDSPCSMLCSEVLSVSCFHSQPASQPQQCGKQQPMAEKETET